jgi:hypothetical protein
MVPTSIAQQTVRFQRLLPSSQETIVKSPNQESGVQITTIFPSKILPFQVSLATSIPFNPDLQKPSTR